MPNYSHVINKTIQATKAFMPDLDEYMEEIRELWGTHWITNMGVKHKKLETELAKYLNAPNIILFTNGHLALEYAIEAFGLKGEIITTPFTFASTTHAIVRKGLKPVFCDINFDDYTLDANRLEQLVTKKTSAIIPVHIYGNICDIYNIEMIAKKYRLKVIYDAAHAFGVTFNDVSVANFGDISMFSFHATKIFNTIEGGALTFKDTSLTSILKNLKNFGITGPESVVSVGGNAKMNEFQAAMGICNLRHIDSEIEKRKLLTERYRERLSDIKGIKLSKIQNKVNSNNSYFPIIFDGFKLNRDEAAKVLANKNIYARKYFYPLVSEYECYKDSFNCNETPVAKYISDRVLTLPLYGDLTLKDVDKICDILLTDNSY